MKKLTLGLAVLLAGYAANSLASLPTGASTKCDVCVPTYCGGFTFGATGLAWRATTPRNDYAVNFPAGAANEAFTGPIVGEFHSVDHDRYDWGFKANIGYVFPCSGNDITVTYTHWRRTRDDSTINSGALLPILTSALSFERQLVVNLLTPVTLTGEANAAVPAPLNEENHPAVPVNFTAGPLLNQVFISIAPEDVRAIRASSRIKNDALDVDLGQAITAGCNFHGRWTAGVRYAKVEQDLRVKTIASVQNTQNIVATLPTTIVVKPSPAMNPPNIAGPTTANVNFPIQVAVNVFDFAKAQSKFEGVGPRFGFDASYNLCGGFGIVGNLSTSLLVGRTRSDFRERVASFDSTITFLQEPSVVIEPRGDAKEFQNVRNLLLTPPFGTPVPVVLDGTTFVEFNRPRDRRVVPNIDGKLGLDYTYQFCNCSRTKLTVEAGYYVSHYFDVVDTVYPVAVSNIRPRQTYSLSFDGPYVAVQVVL